MTIKTLPQTEEPSVPDYGAFRVDGFYPAEYPGLPKGKTLKQVAADSAKLNPGTLRVETVDGTVLWRAE